MPSIRFQPVCFGLLWLAVVAFGFKALFDHSAAPGSGIRAPRRLPTEATALVAPAQPGNFDLFLFIHPQCPCSGASLENVDRLLANTERRLDVHVVLYEPSDAGADWASSAAIDSVRSLANVTTVHDRDGRLAAHFGAETSGSVALYDSLGELRFEGGITDARGHAGDSAGIAALTRIVREGATALEPTPVYGCEILALGSSANAAAVARLANDRRCENCDEQAPTPADARSPATEQQP